MPHHSHENTARDISGACLRIFRRPGEADNCRPFSPGRGYRGFPRPGTTPSRQPAHPLQGNSAHFAARGTEVSPFQRRAKHPELPLSHDYPCRAGMDRPAHRHTPSVTPPGRQFIRRAIRR